MKNNYLSIREAVSLRAGTEFPLSAYTIREAAKKGKILALLHPKAILVERESLLSYVHVSNTGSHLKGRPAGAKDKQKRRAKNNRKGQNKRLTRINK